jgi:hypothetical protein
MSDAGPPEDEKGEAMSEALLLAQDRAINP